MARYPKNSTPKLTNKLIEDLSRYLKSGCFLNTALSLCEISRDTYYRWKSMAKEENASPILKELSYTVDKAIAQATMLDIEVLNKVGRGIPEKFLRDKNGEVCLDDLGNPIVEKYRVPPDWRCVAWKLERRHRSEWGKSTREYQEMVEIERGELDGASDSFAIQFVCPDGTLYDPRLDEDEFQS
jgi:hypothetical protein